MEVSLGQILEARERRVLRQNRLLAQFGKPLICFTMNIAGPEKYSERIAVGFRIGCRRLETALGEIPVLHSCREETVTGCEGYYVCDADPKTLKTITCKIEEADPLGRLFDMDVLTASGKEARPTPRKCLLCGNAAMVCGRSRAHSVAQLQEKTHKILTDALAEEIAQIAVQSLLCELYTTPKPGLVDLRGSGSHSDMDLFTFLGSAASLWPYFRRCAHIGMDTARLTPEQTFPQLQQAGLEAEQAMYRATGGINTHKGAIFSLGLFCGAAGRLLHFDPVKLGEECAAMTKNLSLSGHDTAGGKLYAAHGITGARGQAMAGFPAVINIGLPALEQGLHLGMNRAGCGALLAIMAQVDDTNLIKRSSPDAHRALQQELQSLLAQTPYPDEAVLAQLDDRFIERNLSPGGSADLLAASFFLHFLRALTKEG